MLAKNNMGTSLMVGAIGRVWHGFTAKCYNYMIDLASRETALYWLFAISFIESSFFRFRRTLC